MDDNVAQADISSILQSPRTSGEQINSFTGQTAAYFGSYVSGNLSADGLPMRIYGDSYESGLIRKLSLERFPQLNKNIYKNFVTGLGQQTFVIAQNKYSGHQDEYIVHTIRNGVLGISGKKLAPLLQSLAFEAEAQRIATTTSHVDSTASLMTVSKRLIARDFITPYILPLDILKDSNDTTTKATLLSLQEAATSRVYDASKEALRQVYTAYLASPTAIAHESLVATLGDVLTPQAVQNSLEHYVEYTQISDAYQHAYALHLSTTIDETKSIYVYLGELKYESVSYPLFYTKVTSTHTFPSVTFSFENRIFVNKQAIEYVLRQFANRTNRYIDIAELEIPSVIHSAEQIGTLQAIVTRLTEAFGLAGDIKLSKSAFQETSNHFVGLTNEQFFYVDSSFAPAITNDYADILQNKDVRVKASKYISKLLLQPSTRFVEEVKETWKGLSYFDKLLPVVPLSINDEQKQVLIALDNPQNERVVIDSPDSTGKSHAIRAAVLATINKGKSVLVVGNSPEAARKLHQDIGIIMHQATGSKDHNPVLDLHATDTLERLDDQVISHISASKQLVGEKLSDLTAAKKRKVEALKDSLKQLVRSAENINLHEVEQAIQNDRRFAGKHWIEGEPIEDISMSLQQLHRAIQYVRGSEASYLMPYVDLNKQQAMEEFLSAYTEYEKANKNVNSRLPDFIVRYKKLLPEQRNHLKDSLAYIQSNYRQYVKILKETPASNWLPVSDSNTFQEIKGHETEFNAILDIAQGANRYFAYGDKARLLRELDSYNATPLEIIEAFDTYVEQIATLKSKLFGFSGRMLVVENLNKQLIKSLPSFGLPNPEKQSDNMQIMSNFVKYTTQQLAAAGMRPDNWKHVVRILLSDEDSINETHQILSSLNQLALYDFTRDFRVHEADNLLANIILLDYATDLNRVYREFPKIGKLFGITTISHLLARPHEFTARASKLSRDLHEATQLNEAKDTIRTFVDTYPDASNRLGIVFKNSNFEVVEDTFANSDSEFIKEYIAYKKKEQDIRTYFDEVTTDAFADLSIEYQQILGVELQYALNEKFLDFTQQQSAIMGTISDALKSRRQLSQDETAAIMSLYPCVTSEVHQLSSMLPLAVGMFDLVIIDTADSMTIAETLPAALRGKQLLVVGDSAQTRSGTEPLNEGVNSLYTKQLTDALRGELSQESADNKNSIITKQTETFVADLPVLRFFAAYANYDVAFKKQYGVYEELASFGSKFYYDNAPVSLTSRAVPLAELFTFSHLKPSQGSVSRFTNQTEADHIIAHLHTLKEQGFSGTIGIVTPFAEQAALIQKELDESVITDWFERRDLRVMTFDSKRQFTRDYTFYSLVASGEFNELAQKLPSAIGFDAFEHDDRSQRLLTGFTGTRHAVHIVHSLPFDAYGGSLSETLKHFAAKSQGPTVAVKGGSTDVFSPTEINISQSFEKTVFAKKYKDRLSFVAKYPFANYIKPLSPNFHKALYKVFFLVMIDNRPLVVEFDDFKDRFLQNSKSDKENAGTYLTAQDIYGYKILEGYGYRFLRLNKFSAGTDPTQTLDKYLSEMVKTPTWPSDNGFVA